MTLYFDLDSFSNTANNESADHELLKRVDRRVELETRGEVAIAWLSNAPMNAISPQVKGVK